MRIKYHVSSKYSLTDEIEGGIRRARLELILVSLIGNISTSHL